VSLARVVLAVARADARERMRRYSFLVTLGAAIYIGYLVNAGWMSLRLSGYRGVANSAWVGSQMAVIISALLTLVGFYLVKGCIARDHETGVGEILATTRLSRVHYMLGKLLSNAAVLAAIVVILAVAAVVMQLLAGETGRIDIVALLAPLALIALPAMAATAALAVLFESIRPLRGGLGNVVFFFAWGFLLVLAVEAKGVYDLTGVSLLHGSMLAALHAQYPAASAGFAIQIHPPEQAATFVWDGLAWTPAVVAGRLAWFAVAAVLALIAAALFDRFDPARGGPRPRRQGEGGTPAATAAAVAGTRPTRSAALPFAALAPPAVRFSFVALWLAELRLLLAGRRVWWLLMAGGLVAAQLAAPAAASLHPALVLAWIWPLLVWSPMGCRPLVNRVDQVLWSAPAPVRRQLPAEWLAGAAIAALAGSGAAVRLLLAGDARGIAAWASACLLIPALALALGTLTRGSKTFEIVWLVFWYVGLLQKAPFLDVVGTTPMAVGRTAPLGVALAAVSLVAVAALVRSRQLRG
jgi:hypothetical protein